MIIIILNLKYYYTLGSKTIIEWYYEKNNILPLKIIVAISILDIIKYYFFLFIFTWFSIFSTAEAVIYTDAEQRYGITSNYSLFWYISCSSSASENSLSSCAITDSCARRCNPSLGHHFYGLKCLGETSASSLVSLLMIRPVSF